MLTPLQHKQVKEKLRLQGYSIHSIYSYDESNTREVSTVKDILIISKHKKSDVLNAAIEYFNAIGYIGSVQVRKGIDDCWTVLLSNRIKPHSQGD